MSGPSFLWLPWKKTLKGSMLIDVERLKKERVP